MYQHQTKIPAQKCKNSLKNNLATLEITVDISATTVAFFGMTWLTSVHRRCGEQLVIDMTEFRGRHPQRQQ